MREDLDFDRVVNRINTMMRQKASVVVSGTDEDGTGVVAELTGVLRTVGPDPNDPHWGKSGPWAFGLVDQENAFYVDPDAFVRAWASGRLIPIDTSFGSVELAGPISRPDWF